MAAIKAMIYSVIIITLIATTVTVWLRYDALFRMNSTDYIEEPIKDKTICKGSSCSKALKRSLDDQWIQ